MKLILAMQIGPEFEDYVHGKKLTRYLNLGKEIIKHLPLFAYAEPRIYQVNYPEAPIDNGLWLIMIAYQIQDDIHVHEDLDPVDIDLNKLFLMQEELRKTKLGQKFKLYLTSNAHLHEV